MHPTSVNGRITDASPLYRVMGKLMENGNGNGNGKLVKGKITKLDPTEGWGFLSSDEIKFTRIFFHWSALRKIHFDNLKVGMEVEFKAVDIPEKGWRAFNIQPIKKEAKA